MPSKLAAASFRSTLSRKSFALLPQYVFGHECGTVVLLVLSLTFLGQARIDLPPQTVSTPRG
jgi:hypothetical protein